MRTVFVDSSAFLSLDEIEVARRPGRVPAPLHTDILGA